MLGFSKLSSLINEAVSWGIHCWEGASKSHSAMASPSCPLSFTLELEASMHWLGQLKGARRKVSGWGGRIGWSELDFPDLVRPWGLGDVDVAPLLPPFPPRRSLVTVF